MNAVRYLPMRSLLATASLMSLAATTTAQVSLADQPVFSAVSVPGNLALALSVEFPTAISVAHPRGTYAATNTYVGYFDPQKCYAYRYTDGTSVDNYFYPVAKTTTRTCTGQWSGNYLNWASMQTIDPFRWALTGGYRVIDTDTLTVLEKAWATVQGGTNNFPDSGVGGSTAVAGATPFSTAAGIATRIWSLGNKMRFMTSTTNTPTPNYGNAATHYNPANTYRHGTLYEVFIRVKVCDKELGLDTLENNCTAYSGGNYKPTGLMQQYADKIRYSAFGYLNDSRISNNVVTRDGGVLRAKQKFIGPTMPVPGGLPVANPKAEWDATTGVMLTNPDATDATAFGVAVANSGAMNYLNKFGQINPGSYKTYDPVGELYYAVQRYLRNKGNVTEWTAPGAANASTLATWADGFPVITTWDDPVQYSCQRNFILGIGDVNTHADRNLPGSTGSSEPAKPAEVASDTAFDATVWTNRVGVLQGLSSSLAATQNYGGCCTNNGALMAGLAYWANINDVRTDLAGTQTIQTYWLDVLENGYKSNNQFYLTAKYGGFKVPDNYADSSATAAQFANNATTKSWWSTTADTMPDGTPRPDNYYTASRADLMVTGLTKAFSSIASQLSAYSTSFVTSVPQIATLGVSSYASKYDAKTWSGDVVASLATIDTATGKPNLETRWSFADKLATQAAGSGWDTGRNIVTYNTATKAGAPLRSTSISADQLTLLNTSYTTGDDSANYLNYLRGDRKHERSSTISDSTRAYRDRAALVGDIVNAKVRPVGPPSAPYSSVTNPGYDTFKTDNASRIPMVFAGTNAGMLHGINGSLTGNDAGKEIFAYVPGALFNGPTSTPNANGLASVGNPEFTHRFQVDASPVSADVDLGNTAGGSGTDWRTLLVGGLGKGGKTIYALDITKPSTITSEATAAQKVLWEFTDPDLGYTYGQPVIVKTKKYGWVVVVASGYNNADGKGYFFFINPRTGALVDNVKGKIEVACSDCSASKQMGLAHINAFIIDLSDGVADAIYGGDLMGNLWRLDVSGTGDYPAPVKLATLTGSDDKALPVTSKPLPVVQPGTNRRYITVGTGRLLDSSDLNSGQAQRFFAILDGTNAFFAKTADLPEGLSFPFSVANMRQLTDLSAKITLDLRTEVGWYVDLGVSAGGPGWRVLSDPVSYQGTVAFAATAPSSGDACSPNGNSRVYAIDLGSGACALKGTGASCYVSPPDGVVVDVQIVADPPTGSDPNKVRVVYGDDRGKTGGQEVTPPGVIGLQRLNWREIIIRN